MKIRMKKVLVKAVYEVSIYDEKGWSELSKNASNTVGALSVKEGLVNEN